MQMRVTSSQGLTPSNSACAGQHSFFRKTVAAMASRFNTVSNLNLSHPTQETTALPLDQLAGAYESTNY